jgi:hypothetical protein
MFWMIAMDASSTCQRRQDLHVSVRRDRLQQVILIDLAIDGDGDAGFKVFGKRRKPMCEGLQQFTDGRNIKIELRRSARTIAQWTDQSDASHRCHLPSWPPCWPKSFGQVTGRKHPDASRRHGRAALERAAVGVAAA